MSQKDRELLKSALSEWRRLMLHRKGFVRLGGIYGMRDLAMRHEEILRES